MIIHPSTVYLFLRDTDTCRETEMGWVGERREGGRGGGRYIKITVFTFSTAGPADVEFPLGLGDCSFPQDIVAMGLRPGIAWWEGSRKSNPAFYFKTSFLKATERKKTKYGDLKENRQCRLFYYSPHIRGRIKGIPAEFITSSFLLLDCTTSIFHPPKGGGRETSLHFNTNTLGSGIMGEQKTCNFTFA